MGREYGLFNEEELKLLRGQQLDMLRQAVRKEIGKAPFIRGLFRKYDSGTLRKKVLPLYNKLTRRT